MGRIILERGIYKGDETIQENISEDTSQLLNSFLMHNSIPLQDILKMKPAMLAFTLSTLKLLKMGFTPEYGIDMYFCQKANGEKSIIELETMEEQLSLIFDMPNENLLLKYTLLDLENMEKLFRDIVESWRNGDQMAMEKILLNPYEKYPEFKPILEKMFYERNIKMVSTIKDLLKEKKKFFVVVGAGHLVGENGIIQLMQSPNYTIQQL